MREELEPRTLRPGREGIEAELGVHRQALYDMMGSTKERASGRFVDVKLSTWWKVADSIGLSLGRLIGELSRPRYNVTRALARARRKK